MLHKLSALFVLTGLLAAPAAMAHHSFSMFDASKTVTLHGVVKEFEWTNPHAVLLVETTPAAGAPAELWSVEVGTSPGNLKRLGWTKHSLEPGEAVDVDIAPSRNGAHGGSFKKAIFLASGTTLEVSFKALATPSP